MELFESNKVFKRLLRQTNRGKKGSLGGGIWDWRIGGDGGVRRRGSRLGGLGLIASGGSRLLATRLVAGGAVELRLAVRSDLWRLLFTFLLRPIQNIAFDSTFARSQHLPVTAIEYLMMTLIAMTIVATLKMVGIVLAISLLTIPQMTANLFTYSYKRMIGASIVIGCIDCLVGLYASYLLNVPSGATIIFVSIILFAAARILAARKH